MHEPGRAVFLSYASQDADAAKRICEALRQADIEVWFDQEELRGGDAWDAKIRRQIHECALFVPVISQHTQSRREGYFRREWKLGVDRLNDMAEGTPFIVPVCVDATRERDALVPAAFLDVQWTRLPAGEVSNAFVDRVTVLVGGDPERSGRREPFAVGARRETLTRSATGKRRTTPKRWLVFATGGVATAAAVMVVLALWWRWPAPSGPGRATKAASSAFDAKSIAVLPFDNMSEDKDASAFFADGMHEDIITSLALIRELRVTSRTTAQTYRDSPKPLRQIGEELGVAYVLEGSVRRAGNRVRVTGQLIDARTDEHVWAKSFDRDLTDIFAIQSGLAQAIATELQATLSPEEKALIERRPTNNVAAYDLFVQARDLHRRDLNSPANLERAAALAGRAVELDAAFAAAWAEMVSIHAVIYGLQGREMVHRDGATSALAKAEHLAPGDPETLLARADYYHFVLRDLDRAAGQLRELLNRQPNNADTAFSLGLVLRRQGRWLEAVAAMRRAVDLDGRNPRNLRNLAQTMLAGRRFAEAIELQQRAVELDSYRWSALLTLASYRLRAGGVEEANAISFEGASVAIQIQAARTRGDFGEIVRLDSMLEEQQRANLSGTVGASLLGLGRLEEARARVRSALGEGEARLATSPEDSNRWMTVATLLSIAGRHDEALAHGRKSLTMDPESRFELSRREAQFAWIRAWSGDTEGALADYARLLRIPSNVHVHQLRTTPLPAALRDDPRFKALLDDPANNAPLF